LIHVGLTNFRSGLQDPELSRNVFLDATNLNIIMPLVDPVTMASTSPTKTTVPAKLSIPVELLPTDLARIVSQAHPVLLLSAYYIRFPALVADPVSTLLNSLLPLAAIQIVYAFICLPAVGTTSKPVKKAKSGEKKKTPEASSAKALVYLVLFHMIQIKAN
jgi:phosphatidylinositol glycan class F